MNADSIRDAAENSKLSKRSQREAEALRLASTPLRDLLLSARNGNGRSLRYLLDQRQAVLFKTSKHMCRCLGHLGRFDACPGQYCDRAWSASYHTLASKVIGLSSAKNKASIEDNPKSETTIRPTTMLDDFTYGDIRPRSVLGAISELKFHDLDDAALRESWEKMASAYLRNIGTQTDCLRTWNTERGLVARIDQSAYFLNKDKEKMPFYKNILKQWEELPEEPFTQNFKFSEKPPLDVDVLIGLIRCLYTDATQWGYAGSARTNLRLVKLLDKAPGLQTEVWKNWVSYWLANIEAGLASDDFDRFFEAFELILEVSRVEKSREGIIRYLNKARDLTRCETSRSTDITSDLFDTSYLEVGDEQMEFEEFLNDEGFPNE